MPLRDNKEPTISEYTSDPFLPFLSTSSVLLAELLSFPRIPHPPSGIPEERRCGASALALTISYQDYAGEYLDLLVNKGSYFRGDLATALTGLWGSERADKKIRRS